MSPIQNTDVLAVTRPTVGTFKMTVGDLKTFVATAPQVQTDWNADPATLAGILNKPGLATSTPPMAGLLPGPDKVWIDAERSAGPFVRLSGDTMTGSLNLEMSNGAYWRWGPTGVKCNRVLTMEPAGTVDAGSIRSNANGKGTLSFYTAAGASYLGEVSASPTRVELKGQYETKVVAGATDATGRVFIQSGPTAAHIALFYLGGTLAATVSPSGAWTVGSDIILKESVEGCGRGLSDVLALRPVQFRYGHLGKEAPTQLGFIAQEVQAVVPEAVSELTDGVLGVAESTLIPVLVKAVQELTARLAVLEGAS
jgi:hypothetical protein